MPITAVGLTTGDFAWTLQTLPEALDRMAAFGIDSVELSLSAFDVVVGGRIIDSRLRRLKAACAASGLKVTVHAPISSTFTSRSQLQLQLDNCRASLDVSGEVGASVMVWHSGGVKGGETARIDEAWSRQQAALAEVAPHAAGCGVTIAVENIFGIGETWSASPAELAEQIKTVNHPNIRATIDASHGAINATLRGYNLMESLAALAPWTAHLHVHDSFGLPQTFRPFTPGDAVAYGVGDLHLPPGWSGVLDWEAIAALPFAPNAEITANLELSANYSDEMADAIALCRRMMAISRDGVDIVSC